VAAIYTHTRGKPVGETAVSPLHSLRYIGHFPGEPELAGFIVATDNGSGGDNWSYKTCKTTVNRSSPTNQKLVPFN